MVDGGVVGLRQLNRWTLARQHLLARAALDAATAIEALAGMQAQHPPAPYVGLWSRLEGFRPEHLVQALAEDRVVKGTFMRGTLHLVATSRLAHHRLATMSSYHEQTLQGARSAGADLEAIRAAVLDAVAAAPAPPTRREIGRLVLGHLPPPAAAWAAARPWGLAGIATGSVLLNLREDGHPDHTGPSRYRPAPAVPPVDPHVAHVEVVRAYLAAYGPATAADLAQWSGRGTRAFAAALAGLDLVRFQGPGGAHLLDLPDAPRPDRDVPAPVRFLPKWDQLLLAHARRDRVLPPALRPIVIAKNGDVAPTVLVDGVVRATWRAPSRGPAVLEVTPLADLGARRRRAVEAEGRRLLRWLRPGVRPVEVRWA